MKKLNRILRIVRVLDHRTEVHIKVGLPIFLFILFLAGALLWKLSTVTHVHFGY